MLHFLIHDKWGQVRTICAKTIAISASLHNLSPQKFICQMMLLSLRQHKGNNFSKCCFYIIYPTHSIQFCTRKMRHCNYNLHGAGLWWWTHGTGSKYYSWRIFSPGLCHWPGVVTGGLGLAIFTPGTCLGYRIQILNTINYVHLHRDDVSLLVRHGVLCVGVLAHHAVQAAVGHLGVARAREVHREHLQ